MEHEEAALLLGAYAVHALDHAEKLLVLAHLDRCSRCQAEVHRYEHVLSFLIHPRETDEPA